MILYILQLLFISNGFCNDKLIYRSTAISAIEKPKEFLSCVKVGKYLPELKEICIYDDRYAGVEYPKLEELSQPQRDKCENRILHLRTIFGTQYYVNWLDSEADRSWIEARNFCREMCMELISLETPGENEWLKRFMDETKVDEVWTSGRFCDFKGCEFETNPNVWPREIYGWIWAGTGTNIGPLFNSVTTDWVRKPLEQGQPNNKFYSGTGLDESCIAMMNNPFVVGIHWHDEQCELRKPFICEQSDILLRELEEKNSSEDTSA